MNNLNYILGGVLVILIFYVGWLNVQIFKIRSRTKKNKKELEELRNELKLVKGSVIQLRNIDLDFSVIENQIEESEQKVFSYIGQELSGLTSAIKDVESKLDVLEEDVRDLELKKSFDEED